MAKKKRRYRSQELGELHAALDVLALPPGLAMDRVAAYFHRRKILCQANGHKDGCVCQQCNDERAFTRAVMLIRGIPET